MTKEKKSDGVNPDDIVKDPATPGQQRALVGFVGKSNRRGFIRLYLSPSFDNYFEINKSDIVHKKELDTDASPLGGTVVWVKNSAQIVQTKMRTFEVESEYLSGRIASEAAKLMRRDVCREDGVVVAAPSATSVFLCGSTSWFLAAPDLPNPWTTSQCNSNSFGNFCTWTADC